MHENQGCYWLIYLFKEAKQVILISDKFPHPTPYTPTTPNPFASQWFGPLPTRSHPRSHLEVCRVGVFLQVCDWWLKSSKYFAIIYLQTMFGQTFIVFYFILLHFTPQKNQTQLLFCCIFLISFFFFFFSLILKSGCHFATEVAACLGKKELYLQNQKQLFEHKHEEDAECSDDTLTHSPWQ